MNKKVLGLTITLPIVTMMATPMVGTVQAKKTTETFTIVPNPLTPTLTLTEEIPGDMNKFSGEGHMLIRSGTQRTYDYDGVLGEGTLIQETIISISHVSGPMVERPPGSARARAFGYGGGIYRIRLEINVDGGYGTGSLEGILNNDWEWDFTTMPPMWVEVHAD